MPAGYQLNVPTVAAEDVDGEVIIINMATGVYVSLVGWSAWTWHQVIGGTAPGAIAAHLESRGIADADGQVARFVDALVADRLVVASTSASPTASDDPGVAPGPDMEFTGLVVERHTDMEDLILLDPVHDVDAAEGWPRAATATE
jgi:hypothetical protein